MCKNFETSDAIHMMLWKIKMKYTFFSLQNTVQSLHTSGVLHDAIMKGLGMCLYIIIFYCLWNTSEGILKSIFSTLFI